MTEQDILLVGGCARSGTTALRRWLNNTPWFYIGQERFTQKAYATEDFDRHLFQPERFRENQEGDSTIAQSYLEGDAERIEKTASLGGVLGDKIPRLADVRQQEFLDNPGVRCLVILRNLFDVASSYKARAIEGRNWPEWRGALSAIDEWNRALEWVWQRRTRPNSFILCYEEFFFGTGRPDALYDFLQVPSVHLPPLEKALARFREKSAELETTRTNILTPRERVEVARRGRFGRYAELLRTEGLLSPVGAGA